MRGALIALVAGAAFAACGGTAPPPASSPAVLEPLSGSNASSYVYQLPADGAFTGELGMPSSITVVNPGSTVTIHAGTSPPPGVPALSVARAAASAASTRTAQSAATLTPLAFLTLTWSAMITPGKALTFAYVPPSGTLAAGATYEEAFDDPTSTTGWQLAFAGPTTFDGTTLLFQFPATLTYAANQTYVAGLYTVAAPAPSPTPAGPLALSTASVSLLGTGTANAQSVTASETAYTGTFAIAAPTCANIASVVPATGAGPSLALTVTGIAAGACSATVTDSFGQSAQLGITVTTSGINAN